MNATLKTMLLALALALACAPGSRAQTARQVLDKTAAVVGRRGGASANFSISSAQYGHTSGSLAIKGRKFFARTPKAMVWFDGKTQWSYMRSTNEVNVSTPTQAQQMSMNPYTFINIYKTGYTSKLTTQGNNFVVHLVAGNQKRTVQELYITIARATYVPTQVRMRQGKVWTTISVSNFKAQNQPDRTFTFHAKDFPQAEVVDLR